MDAKERADKNFESHKHRLPDFDRIIQAKIQHAINETIERCAKVCEDEMLLKKLLDPSKHYEALTPKHLAQAIRALAKEGE